MSEPRLPSGPRSRLLLVEDSLRLQTTLTESLRDMPGLELVGVAETAEEALAAFESQHPDLVILDLSLRGSNGLDVLRAIRQRGSACRVIVFTGYDAEPYRVRCFAAGADLFFSKNRQHRELILLLHHFSGDAPAPSLPPGVEPKTSEHYSL